MLILNRHQLHKFLGSEGLLYLNRHYPLGQFLMKSHHRHQSPNWLFLCHLNLNLMLLHRRRQSHLAQFHLLTHQHRHQRELQKNQ